MPAADDLRDALSGAGSVLLTGPVCPDGDSIGACLALQRVLARLGIPSDVAGEPSYRYDWLPGAAGMKPDETIRPGYGAVVVLDGDRHRLPGPVSAAFDAAPIKGLIDHHASTSLDGYTHPWLDPAAASTCAMLLSAFQRWGVPLDAELAALLYTGFVFDTGAFRYSNTTPETHRAAAELIATGIDHAAICARVLAERRPAGIRLAGEVLTDTCYAFGGQLAVGRVPHALQQRVGMAEGDLEGLIDTLVHTVGTEAAALLVERADGTVKLSLRSRGAVDVARVAQSLVPSGGGHFKAAGASLPWGLAEAEERVRAAVAARLTGATE